MLWYLCVVVPQDGTERRVDVLNEEHVPNKGDVLHILGTFTSEFMPIHILGTHGKDEILRSFDSGIAIHYSDMEV